MFWLVLIAHVRQIKSHRWNPALHARHVEADISQSSQDHTAHFSDIADLVGSDPADDADIVLETGFSVKSTLRFSAQVFPFTESLNACVWVEVTYISFSSFFFFFFFFVSASLCPRCQPQTDIIRSA